MVSVLKIVYKQYAVDIVLILNLGTVIGQFFFNLISQDTITFMSMLKNKKKITGSHRCVISEILAIGLNVTCCCGYLYLLL